MSTIEDPRIETNPVPGSPADPFRYGWRYVPRKQSDGRVELEQIPLTLEDLLFPEEGDFAVQFRSHVNDRLYLKTVFEIYLADDDEAVVLSDCRVDWNLPGVRPLGPDVAVFLGVPRDFDRGTLGLLQDSARPVLVVEITSPDTRKNDFGIKKEFYHRAGVPLYIIIDARPNEKGRRVKLHGFDYAPEGYESIPLDDQGRLPIEAFGLLLASEDGRVICIDEVTGEPIRGSVEQFQARIRAEAHADAETRVRIALESRIEGQVRLIETQNRTVELQTQIHDAMQARLHQAEARADAEARIRIEAEARIREMEAELRRLRGDGCPPLGPRAPSASPALELGWGVPGLFDSVHPLFSRFRARWPARRRITWRWISGPRAAGGCSAGSMAIGSRLRRSTGSRTGRSGCSTRSTGTSLGCSMR